MRTVLLQLGHCAPRVCEIVHEAKWRECVRFSNDRQIVLDCCTGARAAAALKVRINDGCERAFFSQLVEAAALIGNDKREHAIWLKDGFAVPQKADDAGHVLNDVGRNDPIESRVSNELGERLAVPNIVDFLDSGQVDSMASILGAECVSRQMI